MTASLLVLVPVALLVFAAALCFVGCGSYDLVGYLTYSEDDIIPHKNCVAYWPLNEPLGSPEAIDAGGKAKMNQHNGVYRNKNTDAALFPCPPYAVNPSVPVTTPAAPGDLTLGAENLVKGDTEPPHDINNTLYRTSLSTNGGFVSVAANATCNPAVFSFECWVFPEAAAGASRQVFDSRDQTGTGIFGFGLRVNDAGKWEALIGHTNTMSFLQVDGGKADLDSKLSYLVLTFDGTTATVFVNAKSSGTASLPAGETFTPNTTQPLVIGVSGPWLTARDTTAVPPTPEPPALFPVFPFKGRIQCVAIYNTVLDQKTITTHYLHGQGKLAE